jgi:PAS domain S-box-containing protein
MRARVRIAAILIVASLACPLSGAAATERPVVYVGGDRFAPYQYLDADGVPRGFVVELMTALAREANLDLTIRLGSWNDVRAQLGDGTADVSTMALSASRSVSYTEVFPVWHLRQVALFRTGRAHPPRGLRDLGGETVAVTVPSALHDDVMALDPSVRPVVHAVRSAREALDALRTGRVTMAVGNALAFERLRAAQPLSDLHESDLRSVPYCIVIRRGREDLMPVLFDAYSRLREKGELSAIVERTLLHPPHETWFTRWGSYALGLFGIVAAALLGAAVWNRALRSQVEFRTREIRAVSERLELHGLVQAQVSDATIVLDPDLHITVWNAGAEALFGIPAADALGQSTTLITEAVTDKLDLAAIRAQVEREGMWKGETRIRRRDGVEVYVEASVKALRSSSGVIAGRLLVLHDIDARKRAENELRTTLTLHRATLDSTAEAIISVDVNGRITSYNRHLVDTWKVPPDVLASGSFERVVTWAAGMLVDSDEPTAAYRRATATQGPDAAVFELKNGRVIERHSLPQYLDGEIVGRVWTYRDITERTRAEEERRKLELKIQQVQKLESLGVLAGGIAHDFNNLLVGMLGHAGLALMDLPPDSPARDRIQQIELCAMRAAELTNQMLAYSGKGRFVVQPTDLSAVVREMTNLLQTAISKSARLELQMAEQLPAVAADGTQLRQVVMNLITNASDAIGSNPGRIAVTTGVMHAHREYLAEAYVASSAEPGDYVYIEVRDTGCGMDAETRDRIFEPFFTTKFTGRGLGLAAVLGIVRGHQGAVRIDSVPGQGTTFRILFPSCEAPATRAAAPPPRLGARTQARILVVDDEPSVRTIARETLTRAGFTVVTASDGEEALKHFRSDGTAIDAVLLDMTMPGLNGIETLRAIHAIVRGLPIVLTSGYSEQEATDRCGKEAVAGFIQKPFAPSALVAKINDALAVSHPA